MKTFIAVLIGLAAAGAGLYGWQQKRELDRTVAELATTRAALSRATKELAAARQALREVAIELQLQEKLR